MDSTAILTEPTLTAWGIPYAVYRSDEDRPSVASLAARARREGRPVALLLPHRLRL